MATKKTMEPINHEEYGVYLNYVLTGQVENEEHVTKINNLSKRIITLSDATVLNKIMLGVFDRKITQLMDVIQIQQRVLEKLGATDEMFNEAEDEYNKVIAEMQKELESKVEAAEEE